MAQGSTSFWKIFFGVLGAMVVVGGCLAGACVVLVGGAAVKMAESTKEQEDYRSRLSVQIQELVRQRGYAYVRGSVTNNGDRPVAYWKATARFRDKNGAVIDTDYTNSGETLRPGESKNFQIMHRHDPRFDTATVEIDEVRVASTGP